MRRTLNVGFRFAVVCLIEVVSLAVMTTIIPGISLIGTASADVWIVAVAAALVLGLMNVLVRPALLLLTLPINSRTLGFSTLLINALLLRLTAFLLPGFIVEGWGSAILGAFVLAIVNTILTSLTTIDNDYSFFEGIVERLSRRQPTSDEIERHRGLVVIEIDGLSYGRARRAIDEGYMPTIRAMERSGSHRLTRFDCGLPSQTSACQAGIMYGDNYDIPAFRWFDKDYRRMLVSNNFKDAADLNTRFADGRGLLRGGSSICNLMAGDAAKTLLTLSTLHDPDPERRRQEDLYLYALNPYVFARSVVLTLWDVLVELGQALRQKVLDVRPRINRLQKGYPFIRAIANVFLRDLATNMVALDVVRGMPAIYTTYVGYDEVAHHAGPDTTDAFNTLRAIDTQIQRIHRIIARRAPRPYDLIVISDHGQSTGATFRQRCGKTLTQLIDDLTAPHMHVTEVRPTDIGSSYAAALAAELRGVEQKAMAGRFGQAALRRTRKSLEGRSVRAVAGSAAAEAAVTVCASGNLANIYFSLHPGKITLVELNEAHPGLVDALVRHPEVGFVVAFDEDGPLVLGKSGARDLINGRVTGADPLKAFYNPALRAAQLRRLAGFPHAGDLIVNSAVYPDGQVAAFEDLVGSHGGLGGPQTDAFIFHPADMTVPDTSNSAEVFALLDARRDVALPMPSTSSTRLREVDAWDIRSLWYGVRGWRRWGADVRRVLALQRGAFRDIAREPLATGPALLILLATFAMQNFVASQGADLPVFRLEQTLGGVAVKLFGWLIGVMLVYAMGHLLRGRGGFTSTLRALAFARLFQLFSPVRLVPVVGPLLEAAVILVTLLATWMALQESLQVRGQTALLMLPIVVLFAVVSAGAFVLVVAGIPITLEAILLQLGIGPGR